MSTFQRLLLIPCLAPLLALLVLSATNVGDKTRLRLLVWTTPALPLGAWTALAAGGGAVGAALTAFMLLPANRPLKRTQHSPFQPRFREEVPPAQDEEIRSSATPGPERDVREPAPTVSVAYRVVQRPSAEPGHRTTSPMGSSPARSTNSRTAERRPKESHQIERGNWGDDPEADW